MTRTEIFTQVQQVVRQHLDLDLPVELQTELLGDLRLDSIQRLTLVVELENLFQICFEPQDEVGIHTFDDLVGVIDSKLRQQAA